MAKIKKLKTSKKSKKPKKSNADKGNKENNVIPFTGNIKKEINDFLSEKEVLYGDITKYIYSIVDEIKKFEKSPLYTELLEKITDIIFKYKENDIYIYDFLGTYLEEKSRLNKDLGQFFTPESITDFMWKMTIEEYEKNQNLDDGKDMLSILDPACGSGRFFLKFYEMEVLKYFSSLKMSLSKNNIDISQIQKILDDKEIINDLKKNFDKLNPSKKNVLFVSIDVSYLMFCVNLIQSLIYTKIYPLLLSNRVINHTIVWGDFLLGTINECYSVYNGLIIQSDMLKESIKKVLVKQLNESISKYYGR